MKRAKLIHLRAQLLEQIDELLVLARNLDDFLINAPEFAAKDVQVKLLGGNSEIRRQLTAAELFFEHARDIIVNDGSYYETLEFQNLYIQNSILWHGNYVTFTAAIIAAYGGRFFHNVLRSQGAARTLAKMRIVGQSKWQEKADTFMDELIVSGNASGLGDLASQLESGWSGRYDEESPVKAQEFGRYIRKRKEALNLPPFKKNLNKVAFSRGSRNRRF